MVTIPSSSFFLPQYISNQIALNHISKNDLSYGIKVGVKEAIKYQLLRVESGSNEWFYLAKTLARTDKETAFKLATIYHIEDDISQAINWYKQAIVLEHKKALLELIDLYLIEEQLYAAKDLLLPLKHQEKSLIKLIELSLTLGDQKLLKELVPLITGSNHTAFLNEMKKYNILPIQQHSLLDTQKVRTIECRNSVQLFATNLNNLNTLDRLIDKVKEHTINDFICFNSPRYISIEQLNCKYKADSAIKCDDTVWRHFEPEIETRYIGLMLNKGGANVDNGILYLDAFDDVNVFIHELSHLLGFVDEYALPYSHKICKKPQESKFSHNISILSPYYQGSKKEVLSLLEKQISWFSFIDKDTPLLEKVGDNKWKVGTPSSYSFNNKTPLGLYQAETCNKTDVQAFKPTDIKTSLRYYEEPFISLYSMFLTENPDDYLMPSYHYNVAKSLFEKGEDRLGLQWLNKALNYEKHQQSDNAHVIDKNKLERYNKMKLGAY